MCFGTKHLSHTLPLLIASAMLISTLSGCSWVFVDKAPPPPVWPKVSWSQCTDNNLAPVVDTIFAVLDALAVIGALSSDDGSAAALLGAAAGTALWGSSALYGYSAVSNCKAFQASKGHASWRRPAPPERRFADQMHPGWQRSLSLTHR